MIYTIGINLSLSGTVSSPGGGETDIAWDDDDLIAWDDNDLMAWDS